MGGLMWVESEVGVGSTFHFTARFSVPPRARTEGKEFVAPVKLRDLPVLVVDDNRTNREILEEMILNWRMKPVAAENGKAALEMLKHAAAEGTPFRLVLLDGHMPGMDGFEVAARIKHEPSMKSATVILMTSAGLGEDASRAKTVGAAAALTKPVKQSELWDAIVNALHLPVANRSSASVTTRRKRVARQALRILVAEDNPVNQDLALHMLQRRGHSVILAENGRQALDALERHKFDLVLMDVQMPEMGGLEATQAIREREKSRGRACADHCDDGARDAGGPAEMPGRGDGRIFVEAARPEDFLANGGGKCFGAERGYVDCGWRRAGRAGRGTGRKGIDGALQRK